MPRKQSVHVGDEFTIKCGQTATVIDYKGSHDVLVRFDNGYEKRVAAGNLRSGRIKTPFSPSVYGVGYLGIGKHSVWVDGKITRVYYIWNSMMERCYSPKSVERHPTYIDCSVCEEWHNFQVFADWYYQQPNSEDRGFDLDKDLRVLGNKIYSPKTCSFVPHEVNSVLNDCRARKGEWPRGVDKYRGKFRATLSAYGKRNTLGCYSTPEEAHSVYKKEKVKYVNYIANKYKGVIHEGVYSSLINLEI